MIKVNSGKRGKYSNASTGKFFPLNPEKYNGSSCPIFKSSLERKMMIYLDKNPNIIQWTYEPQSIKYFDKSKNKIRKYYIDFTAIVQVGLFKKTIWIEVKPECETHMPSNKNNTKAMMTWLCNESKWDAAKKIAASKGAQFVIITENQLN